MEFDKFDESSGYNWDDTPSFNDLLDKYLIHLKWFLLSLLVFGLFAFLKLRYEVPKYYISGSILIKEKEKGQSFTDLSSFQNLGLFGSGDNSLENEIQILKSRKLITKVVQELKLSTRYFIEDSPYEKEQYPNYPIILNIKDDSTTSENISTDFRILIISKSKFEFIGNDDILLANRKFGENFYADFGNENISDKRLLSIDLNSNFRKNLIGNTIHVSVKSEKSVVNKYMGKIVIEPINEKLSKVLTLSISENVSEKGIAIINNLVEQYNADGINDKKEIAQNTIDFLDLRLGLISTELAAIETTAEQFKMRNRMVDVSAGADYFLQSSSVNERELVDANTQKQLAQYMLDELNTSGNEELLPGNIGLADPSIINMISEYNNLLLQRNRILKSSSTINPIIVNIDSRLRVLKNTLKASLETLNSSLQIQISALNNQSSKINSRIASVPKNEREFKDIVREQETKNALYLFLLQKREESILANAVSVQKAKIIDNAFSSPGPITPKKKVVYLVSILLGLLVPAGVIYIIDLLDTKVHDEKDIRKLKIPYIGDIPLTSSTKDLYISNYDNSSIAESFRYLRTNINFMLDSKERGKIVFVTSTMSSEGKTFSAINLASSLSISGNKTLLLAMDLRAPKIPKYLNLEKIKKEGVTNFIKNESLDIDDIIFHHTNFENLDLINSGDIPPNPVELLMSKRVKQLFDLVKERYEYIIVDTAPVGMVTDTIQISKYADLTIYVIKANYLDKRLLHIPDKLHKENKLPNMSILINGSDHGAKSYGYGYGYGIKKKKPWYKLG